MYSSIGVSFHETVPLFTKKGPNLYIKKRYCNDSGYRTIKYDEQLGVDCLLVRDRLMIQAP